ncbi:MAG TPA: helix-turn-helix domain-containing protein, partial [Bacteroidales bacterium]|nr:helix-turn-helix domain-containing protein [Bacteroidales bacterium]
EAGYDPESVILGEVDVLHEMSREELEEIGKNLRKIGFEIIENNNQQIIEKIKTLIIEMVHYSEDEPKYNHSQIIESKLHKNYNYLSNLFSSVTGTTIEHFLILQKIERAKEFLTYNELSLSEIAFRLGYSSVAHLSSQFRKVTGLTPTHFKEIAYNKRQTIDRII